MPYFPSHDDTRLFFTDWGDPAAPPSRGRPPRWRAADGEVRHSGV